ncbi:hypothetical protein [Raineya orbicola]|jgi:putative cell wall-binding protein|uniref:Uncharacterized protein n=1 Tax=Raineya orbicola TaxID=2016530 RepID=A0A2N3IC33_9BACT|nr:hypothetical protein [Raineya orbicola]PKQ67850.1 hypothetical protein Rain11_1868 [Raineya orbicola]
MEITLKSDNLQDIHIILQLARRMNMEVVQANSWENDEFGVLSQTSLDDIWLTPENEVWDKLFTEIQQNIK